MIRIGLVGDIGSGKSFLAKKFGYPVFNADQEVAKLYQKDKNIFIKLKKNLPKYIHSFPVQKKEISNAILSNDNNLTKIVNNAYLLAGNFKTVKFLDELKDLGFGMATKSGLSIAISDVLIQENKNKYECFIANDNSEGQVVVSGKTDDIDKFSLDLKSNNIKNIKLPVSAPFHCNLMKKATEIMSKEIENLEFKNPKNVLISNVTGKEITDAELIKQLLVKQIESTVRWRESVLLMIAKGTDKFIEIGPGKVLSGLIKRIDKNVKVSAINTEEDIKLININD